VEEMGYLFGQANGDGCVSWLRNLILGVFECNWKKHNGEEVSTEFAAIPRALQRKPVLCVLMEEVLNIWSTTGLQAKIKALINGQKVENASLLTGSLRVVGVAAHVLVEEARKPSILCQLGAGADPDMALWGVFTSDAVCLSLFFYFFSHFFFFFFFRHSRLNAYPDRDLIFAATLLHGD
jgi:hypothetical protein